LEKIRLLLIENSEREAITIAEFLESSAAFNYEIVNLVSLEETYQYLSENTVDIILVNLALPDSFGIHTFNALFKKYPKIPFLIITGIDDHEVGINAVKLGAQDYLLKHEINGITLNRSISYAIERKKAAQKLRKSEEKYRELFVRSRDAIYMSTIEGDFIDINPAGLSMFGYEPKDVNNLKVRDLYFSDEDREKLTYALNEDREISDYEVTLKKKDGKTKIVCLLSSMVIYGDNRQIIGYQGIIKDITARKSAQEALFKSMLDLDQANKELSYLNTTLEQKVEERTNQFLLEKRLVEEQHKEITESIQYAKRIQASILPAISKIKATLDNSFIYYSPKDVVSGDFYWFDKVKNTALVAVVDCTGHGVPGAFMSIIGYTQLNEIVSDRKISDPGIILKELDKRVRIALNQNAVGDKNSNDGMELGILSINLEHGKIEYAGAMRPLYLVKNHHLHIVKGDKFAIGGASRRKKDFTTHRLNIEKGDCYYLFSDGYPDQFGGPRGKKFMTRNVGEMLQGISHLEMYEQGKIVKETIKDWMKNEEQVDDILIMGMKF